MIFVVTLTNETGGRTLRCSTSRAELPQLHLGNFILGNLRPVLVPDVPSFFCNVDKRFILQIAAISCFRKFGFGGSMPCFSSLSSSPSTRLPLHSRFGSLFFGNLKSIGFRCRSVSLFQHQFFDKSFGCLLISFSLQFCCYYLIQRGLFEVLNKFLYECLRCGLFSSAL